ncbi:MAG TPA: thioesterase domain-containing protein [Flavisolibacter sp.]|jgi:thioesterase domain-containing protein
MDEQVKTRGGATPATGALRKGREHIIRLNAANEGLPVFIVPGSIGMSDGYHEIGGALADACPVYGLQMYGIYKGEKPLDNIEEIVTRNISWIKELQPRGPYRFIAHSFGGHVAYEMCRRLERQGETVTWTVIMDASARPGGDTVTDSNKVELLLQIAFELFEANRQARKGYGIWGEELKQELSRLHVSEMVPFLRKFLQKRGGDAGNTEFLLNMVDLRFQNMLINSSVEQDAATPIIVAKAAEEIREEETLGWNATHVLTLPGNHFSMCHGEGPKVLARFLAEKRLLSR